LLGKFSIDVDDYALKLNGTGNLGNAIGRIVDSRREYVKYLLNGGYESINDIEFGKRLNQYHSAED
jgi:hypothetical protein